MKKIEIYTDGACSGNPGPGGWGAVLLYNDKVTEISGKADDTTNNQMEIRAVIEALTKVKETCEITIITDSVYVKNGITQWIINWKKNNWRTANKQPVKNKELWLQLDELCQGQKIEWKWVKGHSGNKWNDLADKLATSAICK
jgi:ribonuclease HI